MGAGRWSSQWSPVPGSSFRARNKTSRRWWGTSWTMPANGPSHTSGSAPHDATVPAISRSWWMTMARGLPGRTGPRRSSEGSVSMRRSQDRDLGSPSSPTSPISIKGASSLSRRRKAGVVRSGQKSMGTTFLRAASVVTLALVPILVGACGSYQGGGFLLGAFSSPVSRTPAASARVLVSTPGNGAVLGGIGNSSIGRQMSTNERGIAADAEFRALEYGRSGAVVAWAYPALHHRGSIVPGRPYKRGDQYCRVYTHTINRGASTQILKGVACREDNGTWRGVS